MFKPLDIYVIDSQIIKPELSLGLKSDSDRLLVKVISHLRNLPTCELLRLFLLPNSKLEVGGREKLLPAHSYLKSFYT